MDHAARRAPAVVTFALVAAVASGLVSCSGSDHPSNGVPVIASTACATWRTKPVTVGMLHSLCRLADGSVQAIVQRSCDDGSVVYYNDEVMGTVGQPAVTADGRQSLLCPGEAPRPTLGS